MRLKIDFSNKASVTSLYGAIFFFVAIASLIFAVWEAREEYIQQQTSIYLLTGARHKTNKNTFKISLKQAEAVNEIIDKLNFPWSELLAAIEGNLTEHVALLTFEPGASERLLRLQAEAKSPDDMIDFVNALDHDRHFLSATITRHEINQSDRNRPYRFVVEIQWPSTL